MKTTSKEYFNALNIIYLALILGQVFFAIISIFINLNSPLNAIDKEFENVFLIITFLFALAGIFGNSYIFKLRLTMSKQAGNLYKKLDDYRSACIVRWAILEGPSFLAIIGYFLTGNPLFLIMPAGIIGYFIMIRPVLERVSTDLELDYQDKMVILDPNAVISES